MLGQRIALAASAALVIVGLSGPAQGEPIVITHAKVMAGIGGGDRPGYPVSLNHTGPYIVQGNLAPPPGIVGVEISDDNVSLDLNGYTVAPTLTGTSHGIVINGHRAKVHNGYVSFFGLNGIWVRGLDATIDNMVVSNNRVNGIDTNGASSSKITNSKFTGNAFSGITVGAGAHVESNTTTANGTIGVLCPVSCFVKGNTISGNTGDGVRAANGYLIDNLIASNRGFGVNDVGPADVGMSNNFLWNNNPNGARQRIGGVDVHPNRCIGKPC